MRSPGVVVSLLFALTGAACDTDTPRDAHVQCLATETSPSAREALYCGVVERYTYSLELESGRARTSLALRPARDTEDCAPVRSRLPIAHASWNARPIDVDRDASGVVSACGPRPGGALVLDAEVRVPTDVAQSGRVGFSRPVDRFGNAFTYMLGWLEACDLFGPCDTRASELARFDFTIAHAPSTTVMCPGARSVTDDGTRCVIDDTLAPTYASFGILASDAFVRTAWASTEDITVDLYEVDEGVIGAAVPSADIAAFLAHVTSLLGPLPYGDALRVAAAPVAWLGFEHPSSIVLSDTTYAATTLYANPVRHVLFHEIVHQWAGNRTTLDDPYEFVWKEAVAEYVAYAFEEERFPGDAFVTRRNWDSTARFALVYPRPLDEPPPPFVNVSSDAYGTGPMMLLMLEDMIGRARLLEAIAVFLADAGARTTRDLLDAIAAVSGADLGAFARDFVFGVGEPDWPAIEVHTEVAGGVLEVVATQHVRAGAPRSFVVTVRIAGAAQSADVVLRFDGSSTASASIPFGDTVSTVRVDPEHRLLDAPFFAGALRTDDDAPPSRRPLHPL